MGKTGDFKIENGVLRKYRGRGGRVVIPDGVKRIEDGAFCDCGDVTEVVIPKGATSIGTYAFGHCEKLTGVTIPQGVTTIRERAFEGCAHLTDITIPESVMSIDDGAFSGCDRLKSISFPWGIAAIPDQRSESCEAPAGIIIPWGIPQIADRLFEFCESLTGMVIPNSVTAIGNRAFHCCSRMESVVIPGSVKSIGREAFARCLRLKNVVIPDGVTSIDEAAFCACKNLESVVIPDSVQKIGRGVFDGCTSLTDLTIPTHLAAQLDKFLGKGIPSTFVLHVADISDVSAKYRPNAAAGFVADRRDCTDEVRKAYSKYRKSRAAKPVKIADPEKRAAEETDVQDFEIENGVLVRYHGLGGHVVIPDSVTGIGDRAFLGSNVTGVVIPAGVTGIGRSAFSGCHYLSDMVIPESVTSIGERAFWGCHNLTSIAIPRGVSKISGYLFYGCANLTTVTIPDGVACIGTEAFSGCDSLTDILIPDSVTRIQSYAFSGCKSLTDVTIPDGVTAIGSKVFNYCGGLRNLTIPTALAGSLSKFLGAPTIFAGTYNWLGFTVLPVLALHAADISDVSAQYRPNAAAGFAVDRRDCTNEVGKKYLKYIKAHAADLAQMACAYPALLHLMIREKLIAPKDLAAVTEVVQERGDEEQIAAILEYGSTCASPKAKAKPTADQREAVLDFICDSQHLEALRGKTFVVTGKLTTFQNRDELKNCLKAVNARLEETLTERTDFLLTNTPDSGTKKNQQAEKLGVRKITEDELNQMIGRKTAQ